MSDENTQLLSSQMTPFTKFVLPGIFLAMLPIWLFEIPDPKSGYLPVTFWTVACVFLLWWTLPIKRVSLRGDEFIVSNYLKEVSVPVSTLVRIREERWNRTPNITLFFDPPTPFGRKVRIVVPVEFIGSRKFDRIAEVLHGIIKKSARPDAANTTRLS